MLEKKKLLQTLSRAVLLFILGLPLVLIFLPFFTPILIAAFVAFAIEPVFQRFSARSKRKYFAASLFLFLSVFFFIPVTLFTIRGFTTLKTLSAQSIQESQFFRSVFGLWDIVQGYGVRITDILGVGSDAILSKDELFRSANPFIIGQVRLLLSALPSFALSVFVFFSFLVLFATRSESIKKTVVGFQLLPEIEIDHLIKILKSSCYTILVSIVLIGALQAFLVAAGSMLYGFHEFFLIFAITFVLSFIPVIGAAPVALLLALVSFLNGNTGSGVGMLAVAAVAGTVDNILKPYIFSGESKHLHPLVSLFGIVGALLVFGFPGLLLGPLVMQIGLELGPPLMRRLLKD